MNGIVLSDNVKHQIQRYSEDTLTSIVQLDHVGELMHSDAYKVASQKLASFLSGTVMRKKEEEYHQCLKWYEKLGFIKSEKQQAYEHSINRAGKTTALAVNFATTAIPYITDSIESGINKMNFEKFFMSWMGYINQNMEITPIMISNTKSILQAGGVNLSKEKIYTGIKTGQVVSSNLPHLSRRNLSALNSAGEENMNSVAKMIISTADLQQPQVRDRAMEFMEDIFYISYLEAQKKIEDIMCAQEYLSSFVTFSSFDYITFFKDFIASSPEAIKIGTYDVEMDVYSQKRKSNKENVTQIVKNTVEVAGKVAVSVATANPAALMGCINPAISIVKLSEGLMSSTLNPENNPSTGREIMKKIITQRKEYDMKNESGE